MVSNHRGTKYLTYVAKPGYDFLAPWVLQWRAPARRSYLGPMNLECPNCHALHFAAEKLSRSTRNNLKFGMCCLTGQIDLPLFPPTPRELRDLFDGTSPHSLEFKTNIHQYNITFAFTSLGVNVNCSVLDGHGPYAFRISGELHYLSAVLYTAPYIPAGIWSFLWNLVESSRMRPESTGMRLESMHSCRNGTGIHRNDCIPAGMPNWSQAKFHQTHIYMS